MDTASFQMKLCIVTNDIITLNHMLSINIRKYIELFQEVVFIGLFCPIKTKSMINSFILDEAVFSKYCHRDWVYYYTKVPLVRQYIELFLEVRFIGLFGLIKTKSMINSFILDEAVFSKYCHTDWVYCYIVVPFVPRHEFH